MNGLAHRRGLHPQHGKRLAVDGSNNAVAVQHDDPVVHHFNQRVLFGQQLVQTELFGNMLGRHMNEGNRMVMKGLTV